LKQRLPVQIDLANENISFGRFLCYDMAEQRNQVLDEPLEHFWFVSGGCSMSWTTPICCELGNVTDAIEQIRWEKRNFPELKHLTLKLEKIIKKVGAKK
jgi:hypothetical protein